MRVGQGDKEIKGVRVLPKNHKQTYADSKGAYGRTGQKHTWDVG